MTNKSWWLGSPHYAEIMGFDAGSPRIGLRRLDHVETLRAHAASGEAFDVVVIGGGITGAGVALDAALRGYSVLLVERRDFASGTSSKSSKLVHGGLRYLQQGDVALVREALRERSILRRIAPNRVEVLPFLLPIFTRDGLFPRRIARALGSALWAYDTAGGWRIGRLHRRIRKRSIGSLCPMLDTERLAGGYLYFDARADDARLTLDVATTAAQSGAVVLNYCEATSINVSDGVVRSVGLHIDGDDVEVGARCVVNAAGVWGERIDDLLSEPLSEPLPPVHIRPARGVHITVAWEHVQNAVALVLPVPGDRRSVFVVPEGQNDDGTFNFAYVGTTDTDHPDGLDAAECTSDDVEYLLRAVNAALNCSLSDAHVLGVWAGLRPLVVADSNSTSTDAGDSNGRTADLSRRHRVDASASGYVRVLGGKLTTYRVMAKDTVDAADLVFGSVRKCSTERTTLHSRQAALLQEIHRDRSEADGREGPVPAPDASGLSATEVAYACRYESAVTLIDMMTRRCRLHLLDRSASQRMAPEVANVMASELGWSAERTSRELSDYHKLCEAEGKAYTTIR